MADDFTSFLGSWGTAADRHLEGQTILYSDQLLNQTRGQLYLHVSYQDLYCAGPENTQLIASVQCGKQISQCQDVSRSSRWEGERGGRENKTKNRSYLPGLSRKPSSHTTLSSGLHISQVLQLTRSSDAQQKCLTAKMLGKKLQLHFAQCHRNWRSSQCSRDWRKSLPLLRMRLILCHLRWMADADIQGTNLWRKLWENSHIFSLWPCKADGQRHIWLLVYTGPNLRAASFLLPLLLWLLNTKFPHCKQNNIFREKFKRDLEWKKGANAQTRVLFIIVYSKHGLIHRPCTWQRYTSINCSSKGF